MGFVAAAVGLLSWASGTQGAADKATVEQRRTYLGYEDNQEKIRRRQFEQEQILGATKAFSENAGVLHSGGSTAAGYIKTMSSEFTKELEWMKKYAESAKSLGLESASVNQSANNWAAFTGAVSTGMSIYGMGGG